MYHHTLYTQEDSNRNHPVFCFGLGQSTLRYSLCRRHLYCFPYMQHAALLLMWLWLSGAVVHICRAICYGWGSFYSYSLYEPLYINLFYSYWLSACLNAWKPQMSMLFTLGLLLQHIVGKPWHHRSSYVIHAHLFSIPPSPILPWISVILLDWKCEALAINLLTCILFYFGISHRIAGYFGGH